MHTVQDVRVRLVRVPLGAARGGSGATEVAVAHVTVTDGDGATGTGFTYSLTGGAEGACAVVAQLFAPRVTGTQVQDWERTWDALWSATHRVGRGVALGALSAVDIAVWDLRARRQGVPLHRLLGSYRDTVPVYGSGRSTHQMTLDEQVAGAEAYVADGYRAVKLRVGVHDVAEDVARVAAVRAAVGTGVRLMVDCNERLDFPTALALGRRLEDLDVFWIEEPLVADDVAGHARLAERLRLAVAAGEHLQGRYEFAEYVRQHAASVLQPDAPLTGGVTEFMRIANVADSFNLTISPHFLPELHVHLAAAARVGTYVEHFPLLDDLFAESLRPVDGAMSPPDRPGHGILWDTDALDFHTVTT